MEVKGDITITFFKDNIERIKEKLSAYLGKAWNVKSLKKSDVLLYNYYTQAYNSPQHEFILFSPRSNPDTTILFANILDGHIGLLQWLAKTTDVDFYHVSISDGTGMFLQGYHFFHFSQSNNRYVLCYQDPRWTFYEEGKPLPFEDISLYTQRLKKRRLNKSVILVYLEHLGWKIEEDEFWQPAGNFYQFTDVS